MSNFHSGAQIEVSTNQEYILYTPQVCKFKTINVLNTIKQVYTRILLEATSL